MEDGPVKIVGVYSYQNKEKKSWIYKINEKNRVLVLEDHGMTYLPLSQERNKGKDSSFGNKKC